MLRLFWAALAGAAASAVILAGLYLPGAPTEPVFMVPFFIAFACFATALFRINGRWVGHISPLQLWELLRELPVQARILLGAAFIGVTAQQLSSRSGVQSDLGFKRTFVSIAIWLCCCAAALVFAQMRKLSRTTPLPAMSRRNKILVTVLSFGVGLALMATFFLNQRDPIEDEKAAHERLSVAFGQESWYPHLVAANTYHGGFVVYLDTDDPAVQAAACADLIPEAAKQNRTPDLYHVSSGRGDLSGHLQVGSGVTP